MNLQQTSVKKSFVFIFVGLFLFILYLYFFVGFSGIIEVLKRVNPVDYLLYYSLTVVALLLSVLFYSLTWYELLKILSVKISIREALLYCWLGLFVDLVVPLEAVSGEITRVYLLKRNSKRNVGKIIASVVTHRILSMSTVLISLTVSSFYFIFGRNIPQDLLILMILVLTGTSITIILIFYFSVKEKTTWKLLDKLLEFASFITKGRLKAEDLRTKIQDALTMFHQGIEVIGSNKRNLLKPTVYAFSSWFFYLLIYVLVFYALGFEVSLGVSVIVYSISVAVQTIPIGLPVGLVEIVMTSLYSLFNIDVAISGTATTLIRIITFWFQLLVGYIIAQWIGIKTLLRSTE